MPKIKDSFKEASGSYEFIWSLKKQIVIINYIYIYTYVVLLACGRQFFDNLCSGNSNFLWMFCRVFLLRNQRDAKENQGTAKEHVTYPSSNSAPHLGKPNKSRNMFKKRKKENLGTPKNNLEYSGIQFLFRENLGKQDKSIET